MSVVTGPWAKGSIPIDGLARLRELLDRGRELELIDKTPPLPPSGLIDRASLTKLKEELRGSAKLETTPPYHQDDILYAIEKVTKIRYCYVVKGSEWVIWAMERAARLNLHSIGSLRTGIKGRDWEEAFRQVDRQLSYVPHMVPAKPERKEYGDIYIEGLPESLM